MLLEEDRLILHDLRGVNLTVGFFFGTQEEFFNDVRCISYSVCWEAVDVRVDQVTVSEQISDLDFFYTAQQLFIDDHILTGEVINFRTERTNDGTSVFCIILLGKDY